MTGLYPSLLEDLGVTIDRLAQLLISPRGVTFLEGEDDGRLIGALLNDRSQARSDISLGASSLPFRAGTFRFTHNYLVNFS